jgi:hypothetical protein
MLLTQLQQAKVQLEIQFLKAEMERSGICPVNYIWTI